MHKTGRRLIQTALPMLGLLLMSWGCAPAPSSGTPVRVTSADAALAPYRGKVLVLLMGMPGCGGTAKADAFLSGYAARKPAGVEILRIDVPPPNGMLDAHAGRVGSFPCWIDSNRLLASKLEFFYYPTLYVLDRDGTVRYAGECDEAKVETMVAELAAEPAGAPKKLYSATLLKVGEPAADLAGPTLAGRTVTLNDLRGEKATLLLFGATFCPYSQAAAATLPKLVENYGSNGVSVAIINSGEKAEAIRGPYASKTPGLTVVVDETRDIAKAYGVSGVPFFYALKADGTVADRAPFSEAAARLALDLILGLRTKVPAAKPAAGAG